MRNIIIRNAVTSDLPIMCDMLEGLFSIETDFIIDREKQTTGLKLLMNKNGAAIMLADTGIPAGMITGQMVVSTAAGGYSLLIEDLYVMPNFRKQGIASMLVRHLTGWAKEQGAVRAQLVAETKNVSALAFYRKLGFSLSGMTGMYKRIETGS